MTTPPTIALPAGPPVVFAAKEHGYVALHPGALPFKIAGAERVLGIDYTAFSCPGMFVGSENYPAPSGDPWPLSLMFSGFLWPREDIGGRGFHFCLINNSDRQQPFAIRLIGMEVMPYLDAVRSAR